MMQKKITLRLTAAFFGILLFLTFFSNTIYSLNLPGVVVGFSSEGVISSTFRSQGEAEFAEHINVFSEERGRITMMVRENDRVTEGDLLFTTQSDMAELSRRLEDEQNRLERTLVNLAGARSDLRFEQQRHNEAPVFTPTEVSPPDIVRFEREAARLEEEIAIAEAEIEKKRALYEAGVIPRTDLTDAIRELEILHENFRQNAEDKETVLTENEQELARAAESDEIRRNEQNAAFEAEESNIRRQIQRLSNDITLLEMEETEIRRVLERLSAQIEADGMVYVHAEHSGIISEILTESGTFTESGRPVLKLAESFGEYLITAYFPERMGMLAPEAVVRVDIPVFEEYGLSGTVRRITAEGSRLRAEIALSGIILNGGERAEVIVNKHSNLMEQTLPNSAIHEDPSLGYFILIAEREKNTLVGHSYYARRRFISVFTQGDETTAFFSFGELTNPVIITSDRPISEGSRVRVIGDG